METTITKTVKGSIMEQVFESSGTSKISVRHYKVLGVTDENYDPEQEYEFEITIRHPEGTDARKLLYYAIEVAKNNSNA